jgi:hypothetical protein
MDFTADTLADGRNFRTLNIVDDFTRECVGRSIGRYAACASRACSILCRLTAPYGHSRVKRPKCSD